MLSKARPTRRLLSLAVAAALVAPGAAGCGGDGEPPARKLTPSEVERLRDHLSGVRLAAARREPDAARSALRSFRREVRRLADDNALSDTERRRLIDGARQAEARVESELEPEPGAGDAPQPAPAPAQPAPPPTDDGDGDDDDDDDARGDDGKGGKKDGKDKKKGEDK